MFGFSKVELLLLHCEQNKYASMRPAARQGVPLLALLLLLLTRAALAVRDGEGAIASQKEEQAQRQAKNAGGGTLHHTVLPSTSWTIKSSKALGISHCSLPGFLGREEVVLHLWVRFVPPLARRNTTAKARNIAAVRGFGIIQSAASIPEPGVGVQLLQADALRWFSDQVFLWSPITRQRYDLTVTTSWHPDPPATNGTDNSTAAASEQGSSPPPATSSGTAPSPSGGGRRNASDGAVRGSKLEQDSSRGAPPPDLQKGDAARKLTRERRAAAALGGPHALSMGGSTATMSSSSLDAASASSRPPRPYTNNHVLEFRGQPELHPGDVEAFDFQLRAVGLDWHCALLVEPPTLAQHSQVPAAKKRRQLGASRAPPVWSHMDHSTLSNATEVAYLLSPYHGVCGNAGGGTRVNLSTFAHMLWHHATWHSALGISSYILYADWCVSELMREPLIRSLVDQGRLQVVMWVDLPKHEQVPFSPSRIDLYLMQVLIYNHALLALWGTDTLAVAADLDEYLLTHKPMSAVQAFVACNSSAAAPATPGLRAGMQVQRVFATCAPDKEGCSQLPYFPLFIKPSRDLEYLPGSKASGKNATLPPHPLHFFTMAEQVTVGWRQDIKAIMDPNLVREVHVHYVSGIKGTHVAYGDPSCVRILHLWELFKVRQRWAGVEAANRSAVANWWWPERMWLGTRRQAMSARPYSV